MKKIAFVLIALLSLATPVFAQASDPSSASVIPTSVYWVAGIAAFLGFLLGSVPPRGENRGWEFDMVGALAWAIAAAGIAGGGVLWLSTGEMIPAIYGMGSGSLVALWRFVATRPPRVPVSFGDLQSGVHRVQGDTPRAKLKAAERLYKNASFGNGKYFATRSPRDFRFGNKGATSDVLQMLANGLGIASYDTFDILVMLVRDLPDTPGEPGVVVVRGSAQLHAVRIELDGITVPGYAAKIPASAIAGLVGYAWR